MNIENEFEKWVEDYGLEYEPDYSEMHRFDCHAAFVAGVEAARSQSSQGEEAIGQICDDGWGAYVELYDDYSFLIGQPVYAQPKPTVPQADGLVMCNEPFGTESAYQEAKDWLIGSDMNISCALFSELVEKFRFLANIEQEK